ncbi:MAG: T9SS type A sorting domain-containing protein [Bacteroidales bacterium]|nr:T9SS type A sorting domain-containing protein [Bacteroidales bacterium]
MTHLTKFLRATLCLIAMLGVNVAFAQSESITICDGTDENKYVPFYFYYLDNASATSQVIYPASELESLKGKQITGLKFYNAGYSSAWNSNMAVSLAEVEYQYLSDTNASYIEADFTEVFAGSVSGDETMNTLEFTFTTPYVYGGENLVVEIKNTTAGSTYMQIPFYGQLVADHVNATYGFDSVFKYNQSFLPKATISYENVAEYGARVSTDQLNFSTTFTNSTIVKEFSISNTGSNDLTAQISGVSAPFTIEHTELSIPSLTTVTIPVTFAPTADGEYNQTATIALGEAGTFEVKLTGNSMSAPTGYTQAFDVTDKTLPEDWAGWNIKGTYDYDIYDYVFESAERHTEYFVGKEIDGVKAVSIYEDANPRREYPSQYTIYMISPEVSGNIMITARGTYSEYTSGEIKLFKAIENADSTFTIEEEPLEVTWLPEFNNQEWSNGVLTLSESSRIAIFMSYGAVSMFAADQLASAPAVELAIGEKFTQEGITYIVKENRTLGVTSVSNEVTNCIIPEIVTENRVDYTVVSIEEEAFYWSNVETITLPNTIIEIGYGAFRVSPLRSINLPQGLQKIGEYAFYKTQLSTITIPEGITAIEASTFAQCESLTEITLPSTLEKIGQGAFYKCSINSIDIPANCSTIGMYAFESCSQLNSITLPTAMTEIPMGLFQDCTSLTEITIPENVTTIKTAAFQNVGITAIHFPMNVNAIEANTFNHTNITTITADANNNTFTVIDGALYTTDKRFIYLYPRTTESKRYDIIEGCVAVWGGAFYGCDVTEVTFPEGFIGIDAYAFCLSQLQTVELPHSIEAIWEQAFAGTKLTTVAVPDGVTQLYEAVFASCENLTTVTLPAGLTDVGNRAFFQCTALKEINCLGTTPAEFDAWETYTDPFFGVDCSQVTIKCPYDAVEDYKLSEWGDFFTNIEAADGSGITHTAHDNFIITSSNGTICVDANSHEPYNIVISTISGSIVCNATNHQGIFVTHNLAQGVYMVVVEDKNSKEVAKIIL